MLTAEEAFRITLVCFRYAQSREAVPCDSQSFPKRFIHALDS